MPQVDLATARRALHEGALLLPAKELGTITIRGKDRQTWLNGIITCDLAKLGEGQAAYGFAVAKTGKILAEVRCLIDREQILLGVSRDKLEPLTTHFDHYIIMEDVELEDTSEGVEWVLAHGPAGGDVALRARGFGALAAGAVDMSGKGGALLAFLPGQGPGIMARLERQGSAPVVIGDAESFEPLRVEIGLPRWGKDFNEENYPQEASMENLAVSFQKGCYLGQEAVFMLQARGHVKKKLVKLEIEGEGDVPAAAEIKLPDGTVVGSITSAASSPEGGKTVAIGFVKYKYANAGTALSLDNRSAVILL